MRYVSRTMTALAAVLALSFCFVQLPAYAAGIEDVVGKWKMTTNFNGRELESEVVFELKDGALHGVATMQFGGGRGPGGGRGGFGGGGGGGREGGGRGPMGLELIDVKYEEGGTLSWGLMMPRAGNEPLRTTVKIDGETFEGSMAIPFGEAKVVGKKWTEEAERKLQESINALLGDWDIVTTYNGRDSQSQMRLAKDEERGFRLSILMPGSTLDVRRVRFDGTTLTFVAGMPFIGGEPAQCKMTIADGKCEGTITTALGEIPIRGELIDTSKLVVAPYDDPKPVLGNWDVTANVKGEETKVKLAIEPDGERLKGTIQTNDGKFESHDVDYKKVGDKMGRVRLTIVIPSLGEKPQSFELIFNGDAFEGEEIHSNGQIFFEGKRAAG